MVRINPALAAILTLALLLAGCDGRDDVQREAADVRADSVAAGTSSAAPGAGTVIPGADTDTTAFPAGSGSGSAEPPGVAGALPGDSATVTIYFSRNDSAVAAVRRVPADSAVLAGALRQLLHGPTAAERSAGMRSWFGPATAGMLRAASVSADGRAIVDFADLRTVIQNASTSAGSAMLLRELNATVFEFPSIRSVEYRINGSCDVFGEWLQYGCVTIHRPGTQD